MVEKEAEKERSGTFTRDRKLIREKLSRKRRDRSTLLLLCIRGIACEKVILYIDIS